MDYAMSPEAHISSSVITGCPDPMLCPISLDKFTLVLTKDLIDLCNN